MVENITATAINAAGSLLNQVAIGIVILIAGLALGLLVKKITFRILQEFEVDRIMNTLGFAYNTEWWISSLLSYAIYIVTAILFLDQLGIRLAVMYALVAGILLLAILTVVVGLKDILPNFRGWIYLRRQKLLRTGHQIKLPEVAGIVQRIGYLETEIKTRKGEVLHLPNALFRKKINS